MPLTRRCKLVQLRGLSSGDGDHNPLQAEQMWS